MKSDRLSAPQTQMDAEEAEARTWFHGRAVHLDLGRFLAVRFNLLKTAISHVKALGGCLPKNLVGKEAVAP